MTSTLDDRYLEWLYSHIAAVRNRDPARSRWELARQLYSKEFVWLVPNDDNRVEDARELRQEFVISQDLEPVDPNWMSLGSSVLEVLISLARHAAFETLESEVEWFWTMVTNLGIVEHTDQFYSEKVRRQVDDILESFIYRTYRPDGVGGLFPLRYPSTDQTKVELWYQMSAYILERPEL